jgi:hypothetical protein
MSDYIAPIALDFHTLDGLPDGDAGIYATVKKIKDDIYAAIRDHYVRLWAERVITGVQGHDVWGEVLACHAFVKQNVWYVRDIADIETIKPPATLLREIEYYGHARDDCDGMTALLLSLLKSLGHQVRLKVTSYLPSQEFSHVYGMVWLDNEWVAVDTIFSDLEVGDEMPNIMRHELIEV